VVIFAKQDFNTLEMLLPNFPLFLVKFSSRYFLSLYKFFFLGRERIVFYRLENVGHASIRLYKHFFQKTDFKDAIEERKCLGSVLC